MNEFVLQRSTKVWCFIYTSQVLVQRSPSQVESDERKLEGEKNECFDQHFLAGRAIQQDIGLSRLAAVLTACTQCVPPAHFSG